MSETKKGLARVIAGALAAFLLAGCGGASGRDTPGKQQNVSDVIEQQVQKETTGEVASATDGVSQSFVGDGGSRYGASDVDVDLTAMGSDMVYATVYDMVNNSSEYRGKVVRMAGPFVHSHDDSLGNDYYFVIIRDATACCAQGLEFVWDDGSHAWPDDYPAENTDVVVTGVFETYQEGSGLYAHFVNAELEAA